MQGKEFDDLIAEVRENVQRRLNEANDRVPFLTLERIEEAKAKLRHVLRAAAESEDRIATLVVAGIQEAMNDLDRAKAPAENKTPAEEVRRVVFAKETPAVD